MQCIGSLADQILLRLSALEPRRRSDERESSALAEWRLLRTSFPNRGANP